MTYQAILAASVFLLLAFGVERLGRATGIPSAILLIAAGLAGKPALATFGLALEGIGAAVPIVGTLGLILIVLEGALDIKLRRDRLRAASSGFLMAIGGLVVCTAFLALFASLALNLTLHQSVVLAVPFAVISSTIAIPSSGFLPSWGREFVVYESSFSDIVGVLVFFSLLNSDGTLGGALLGLIGGGALSLFLAIVCAVGLVLVLMRIDGHVRFTPLLAGLFGLYAAGKLMHLSPLILVLLFGLMLNNPGMIVRFPPFRGWLDAQYETTLEEFKLLILELTFAVRGFFFILLGYWTNLMELVSIEAWLSAILVLTVVYGSRYILLRMSRFDLLGPLTCIAPRGLITVLLFLAAKDVLSLPHFLYGTVMLVVLVSATMITVGRYRMATADAATASSRGHSSKTT